MPTYEHECFGCEQEFELEYSLKDAVPTVCPLCGAEGKIKRLISLCAGKVYLTGQDLKAKLRADGEKLKSEAIRNETVLADMIGHDKLQTNTVATERAKASMERPRVRNKK